MHQTQREKIPNFTFEIKLAREFQDGMEKNLLIINNNRMSVYNSILTKILKYYKFIEPKKKKKQKEIEING